MIQQETRIEQMITKVITRNSNSRMMNDFLNWVGFGRRIKSKTRKEKDINLDQQSKF